MNGAPRTTPPTTEGVRKMNGIIITALLLVGLVGGVALIDSCKPLWKWIEKQQWWKEIVE